MNYDFDILVIYDHVEFRYDLMNVGGRMGGGVATINNVTNNEIIAWWSLLFRPLRR